MSIPRHQRDAILGSQNEQVPPPHRVNPDPGPFQPDRVKHTTVMIWPPGCERATQSFECSEKWPQMEHVLWNVWLEYIATARMLGNSIRHATFILTTRNAVDPLVAATTMHSGYTGFSISLHELCDVHSYDPEKQIDIYPDTPELFMMRRLSHLSSVIRRFTVTLYDWPVTEKKLHHDLILCTL